MHLAGLARAFLQRVMHTAGEVDFVFARLLAFLPKVFGSCWAQSPAFSCRGLLAVMTSLLRGRSNASMTSNPGSASSADMMSCALNASLDTMKACHVPAMKSIPGGNSISHKIDFVLELVLW